MRSVGPEEKWRRDFQHLPEMEANNSSLPQAERLSVVLDGSLVAPVWLTSCPLLDSAECTSSESHSSRNIVETADSQTLLVMKLAHCPYHRAMLT